MKENSNDVASTIAYSYHSNGGTPTVGYEEKKVSECSGDRELAELLDGFSQIPEKMMSEISTNLSNKDYIELLKETKVALSERNESEERSEVVEHLKSFVSTENSDNHKNHDDKNVEVDTCACHLPQSLQYAANLIETIHVMIPLIKKMHQARILDDLMILLQFISDGTLDADNLPLLLAVEHVKLQNCDTTTGMTYRPETIKFWDVFYRTCHGSGLLLASGKNNSGQIKSHQTEHGKLDPKKGSYNFAVPNIKMILRHQKEVDKFMYTGILDGTFDLVDEMKQFVLEYDGKCIAMGLSDNKIGDVNLWGYEGPPTDQLNEEIELVNELLQIDDNYDVSLLPILPF